MKAAAEPTSGHGQTAACSCSQIRPIPLLWRTGLGLGLALLLALITPGSAQWVTVDSTFPSGSGPNALVRTLAVQADAKVLIGGTFTNVSGSPHLYFARVGTDGVIDAGFVTQVSSEPTRILSRMSMAWPARAWRGCNPVAGWTVGSFRQAG